MSVPQYMGILTCGLLWVNVSSSINGSVVMRPFIGQCQFLNVWEYLHVAFYGSISAPQQMGVLHAAFYT